MLKSAIIAVATLGLAATLAVGSANAVETKSTNETQTAQSVKNTQQPAKAKFFFKSAGKSDSVKLPNSGSYTGPKNAIIINGIN